MGTYKAVVSRFHIRICTSPSSTVFVRCFGGLISLLLPPVFTLHQGADLQAVHGAGVPGLRGGALGRDQPRQRLQGAREPAASLPTAGAEPAVLRGLQPRPPEA